MLAFIVRRLAGMAFVMAVVSFLTRRSSGGYAHRDVDVSTAVVRVGRFLHGAVVGLAGFTAEFHQSQHADHSHDGHE